MKLIKIMSATLLVTALQGCYQIVDQHDINRAIAYCGNIENVVRIKAYVNGDEYASCYDKGHIHLGSVKGNPKGGNKNATN